MTEIPERAVSIWTEGDELWIWFPEGHSVNIPIDEPRRLVTVLKAREQSRARPRLAEESCPAQLQIYDAFVEARSKQRAETNAAQREAKHQKEVNASRKRYEKELATKEAEDILAAAGL